MPVFRGPWASQFSSSYSAATTDLVRAVLKDEKISDAEWAEVKDLYQSCLADLGVVLTWDDNYGGFSIEGNTEGNEQVDDALTSCGTSFDPVSVLWTAIVRNPENMNESEIVAACLVKDGVVDAGYTAKQYDSDTRSDSWPEWLAGSSALPCLSDPLGLLE